MMANKLELGFEQASSANLPVVDVAMVHEFFQQHNDFFSPENRHVKAQHSCRESYGDQAIGYVQVKRVAGLCVIKCSIVPEHKVRQKPYEVEVQINEAEQKTLICHCLSCIASQGSCKHGVAFLFWLHRRSEEPCVTSTKCYWAAPKLSKVLKDTEHMDLASLTGIQHNKIVQKGQLDRVLFQAAKQATGPFCDFLGGFDSVSNNASLHILMQRYRVSTTLEQNADPCLEFLKSTLNDKLCKDVEIATRAQNKCAQWYEYRFGRITASRLFEASKCNTLSGSLTDAILGATKLDLGDAVERGRSLEEHVIKEVSKKRGILINKCGFFLSADYPIFGASPDGITNNQVIEVKCPSKRSTVKNYVENGVIKGKYMAQIQLQMYFASRTKGLFCVASPRFEQDHNVDVYEVEYLKEYCDGLMKNASSFWKRAIYPIMMKN